MQDDRQLIVPWYHVTRWSVFVHRLGQLREHDATRIAKMLDRVDKDSEQVGQLSFDSDRLLHFRRMPTHTLVILKKADTRSISGGAPHVAPK